MSIAVGISQSLVFGGPTGAFPPEPFPFGTVVADTFTANNGTLLTAHTPDVRPAANPSWVRWDAAGGAPGASAPNIQFGSLLIPEQAEGATIDSGAADVAIEVELSVLANSDHRGGIILRSSGSGSGVIFRWRFPENLVEIVVFESGSIVDSSSSFAYTPPASNALINITATAVGSAIAGLIDGVEVVTHTTTSQQAATAQGVTNFGIPTTDRPTFDNFLVRDLNQ